MKQHMGCGMDGNMALPAPGNDQNEEGEFIAAPRDLTLVETRAFEAAFGEPLSRALDLDTWSPGERLADLYSRMAQEIEEAVRQESEIRQRLREVVFPKLGSRAGAPPHAGVGQATLEDIANIHRRLLFSGKVEGCDGASIVHDTLPVTITQIGVCLVSYQGDQGSWVQRLYRRDLRVRGLDPVDEALEVLERRQQRASYDQPGRRDALSDLARRGIMAYVERAVLLHKATAPWRIGHGNPLAYELLTGSGMPELIERSLGLLRELVLGHQRFVFVPSAPADRMLLTIGNALQPLEYAIVDTLEDWITRNIVERGGYRGEWAPLVPKLRQFAADVGSKVVVGVYRASAVAPAHLFYAHVDHAPIAARIALADSVLHAHRGFPMLIDLADTVCRAAFGADAFAASSQTAYAEAGAPFQYLTERQTRR